MPGACRRIQIYESQGKCSKAEPLYLRALAIAVVKLGDDHPNTITCRNSLELLRQTQATQANAKGLDRDAEALYPDTEALDRDAAAMYLDAERLYADAEALDRDAEAL